MVDRTIVVEDLVKHYSEDVRAVDGVSLSRGWKRLRLPWTKWRRQEHDSQDPDNPGAPDGGQGGRGRL
jgi:hypothetical protein